MGLPRITPWLTAALSLLSSASAIQVDITNRTSIEHAASIAGANMLTFYNGTKPGYAPGILTNPYYWWEAGAMFGILIHFWHLTGNDSLNDLTSNGLLFQIGAGANFEPANQTKDLGNDDQAFWAYAALDAAEFGFPNPPAGQPSWLSLAQAVFNRQIARWDSANCGGGLRWQIYSFNPGYDYKNTAANGGLFQIAARLARYTGNQTYADQATRLWNWMESVNFITNSSSGYSVIDGADTATNCSGSGVDGLTWTYNHGTILMGAAYMYNYTNGSALWTDRLKSAVLGANKFFVQQFNDSSVGHYPPGNGTILAEIACEEPSPETCKVDQPAFKAMLIRWMAVTTHIAPWTADRIYPLLNGTAIAAGQACVGSAGTTAITNVASGGPKGAWCGRRWYQSTFDGYAGLGEQLSAMSAFQNVLIKDSPAPYTTVTGGNSTSQPDAGNQPTHPTIFTFIYTEPLGRGDTAGAWILTALGFIIIGSGAVWMVREESEGSWGGAGADASWMGSQVGGTTMYKRTYGYGGYRLAGLSTGGVYAGKNASARRAYGKASMPAQGLGSGGWWFGTGQGVGEKWWEKKEREENEKNPPVRISMSAVSDHGPSNQGLFGRKRANSTAMSSGGGGGGGGGKAGEWKSVGRGVFVRSRNIAGQPVVPGASSSRGVAAGVGNGIAGLSRVSNEFSVHSWE